MPRQSKDVQGQAHGPPIDHYRKQIGKQDTKKSKADLKETKKKSQSKHCLFSKYKDTGLMLLALSVVVLGVYVILFFLLT